jgi:hypothetical protein
MHHHFYTPVPNLKQSRPDIPEDLLDVVTRILSKKPEQRYATTQAMLEAIESIAFPEWQRREGEAWLRALARGAPIPEIAAGRVGPLPELGLTPPHASMAASTPRTTPTRRRQLMAVLASLPLLAGGLWATLRPAVPPPLASDTLAIHNPVPPRDSVMRAARVRTPVAVTPDSVTNVGTRSPSAAVAARPDLVRMTPGKIRIRAYPAAAAILVDGRELGTGVVIDSLVSAGRRKLRVTAPGYVTYDTTFTVAPGETTQLPRIELQPVDDHQ